MNRYVTVGLTVLAGAALFEAALIPGVVIGGAAVMLAPKVLPRLRRLRTQSDRTARRRAQPADPPPQAPQIRLPLARLAIGQALAKTITFRIIVTTLDFTTNYVVIGELTTAAGLSTFNLVAGPLFYLAHEAAWNYLEPSSEAEVDLRSLLSLRADAETRPAGQGGWVVSRAVAKTITFRTIATVVDFTVNYVVVRDVLTAAGLSAFAFVVGPFVYLGHERAWEYFTSRGARLPLPLALPAPTTAAPAAG